VPLTEGIISTRFLFDLTPTFALFIVKHLTLDLLHSLYYLLGELEQAEMYGRSFDEVTLRRDQSLVEESSENPSANGRLSGESTLHSSSTQPSETDQSSLREEQGKNIASQLFLAQHPIRHLGQRSLQQITPPPIYNSCLSPGSHPPPPPVAPTQMPPAYHCGSEEVAAVIIGSNSLSGRSLPAYIVRGELLYQ